MLDLIVVVLLVLPLAAWLALPVVFAWLDHHPEPAESETDRLRRELAATEAETATVRRQLKATEAVALLEGRAAAYWQTRAQETTR